jgi:hypothetical protein
MRASSAAASRRSSSGAPDFESSYLGTLITSIACNSKGELGKDLPNGRVEMIVNKTECIMLSMLVFLRGLGADYRNASGRRCALLPLLLCQEAMSTLVHLPCSACWLYT